jgi:hypothetical protein
MRFRLLLQALLVAVGCCLLPSVAGAASQCSSGSTSESLFAFPGNVALFTDTSIPVCETGRVEVTFSGGPGGGDYAGTDSWQPQGTGDLDLLSYRLRGHTMRAASLSLGGDGGPLQSAVERSVAPGQTAACSDLGSGSVEGFSGPRVRGRRITLDLASSFPLLGTRCAGPLSVDLRTALPAVTLSVSRVLHGRLRIDLRGIRRFSAHGFAGVVRSTLVLRLGRPKTVHESAGSPGPTSGQRTRIVNVTYRVQRLRGTAVADVRASSDAAVCGPLDACGLSGTIDVTPGALRGGSVSLFASAPARRPRRDLLAAVGLGAGANRSGIAADGGGSAQLQGAIMADLTQTRQCRDTTSLSEAQVQLEARGDRVRISLSPAQSQAADTLRTRCPGPELGNHTLTSASVARSVLRHRTFTVTLRGGSFRDGPYAVRTRSTLVLTLRRVRVTTQTYRLPSSPSPPPCRQSSSCPS